MPAVFENSQNIYVQICTNIKAHDELSCYIQKSPNLMPSFSVLSVPKFVWYISAIFIRPNSVLTQYIRIQCYCSVRTLLVYVIVFLNVLVLSFVAIVFSPRFGLVVNVNAKSERERTEPETQHLYMDISKDYTSWIKRVAAYLEYS